MPCPSLERVSMRYIVIFFIVGCLGLGMLLTGCQSAQQKKNIALAEQELKDFITQFEAKVYPLVKDMNLSGYQAAISGKDADFKKAADSEFKLALVYSNKDDFAQLRKFKESGLIEDPLLKRTLEELYNRYVVKQLDDETNKAIIDLQTATMQKFNTFQPVVNGKKVSMNDVDEILIKSKDQGELKAAWLASKEVGPIIANDLIKLVKMRNQAAQKLGFRDYRDMSFRISDEDPLEIEKLFAELDDLTRKIFAEVKADIDSTLSKQLNIKPAEMMPWHYQNKYFQEAPRIYEVDLDAYYKDKDPVDLVRSYNKGIGYDIQDVLDQSDLYEKPGKDPTAFEVNIDYQGDIRILANMRPNYYWVNTLLHEMGHAMYDKYMDQQLPLVLKEPAHQFTSEGVAMMFQRMAANAQWLQEMIGISDAEKKRIAGDGYKTLRLQQLVFSRWSQVMFWFEKGLYEDPDQDLNALWWSLVEKYQMIKKPEGRNEPDWATKIHITAYPCYYHNYLMGELFASQLIHKVERDVLRAKRQGVSAGTFTNHPEVGRFIKDHVFFVGKKYVWNDMIKEATGEKLAAKYYAEDFVNQK